MRESVSETGAGASSYDHTELEEPAMTTPTAPGTRPQPDTYLDTHHQHTRSCFWDYLECRWQCPRATPATPHDPTREAD